MKKTQNKGFTLVELIIVITILAILATVAFVSFSGYAGQARDAKKQSELSNLKNKIEVAIAANSQDVLSLVTSDANLITTVNFAGLLTTAGTNYEGGTINYQILGAESDKYTFEYGIGVVKNTGGSFYQLATKLEDDSIYTTGNYSPRTVDVVTATQVTANQKFTFTGSDIGKFRVGDTLAGTNGLVTKVSSDLSTVETSGTVTYTTGIALAIAETEDLVNITNLTK
ncbi:MAG: type II secretion system GspH family protein [Candidatus Gracilibacteria bacterium]|nr:type II secretion system GspH family protein [Candidatus Gracilibacteria bacterium]